MPTSPLTQARAQQYSQRETRPARQGSKLTLENPFVYLEQQYALQKANAPEAAQGLASILLDND